ncbi:MAG: NAD(P)-dependent oxidoreductase [Deltaproteobacteria bacterium]|nr:NAD(P)-dependent oxidoreductase [Deltaproteobacteria bacterium]
MIAFLGTGLMGAEFVRGLLARGESVRVWNRTRARAEPLREAGAELANDPAEAVRGAARVHLSLGDDAAVESVLEAALPALAPDALVLDHSTTAPLPTAERTKGLRARGIAYVHAPVFMGPKNARDATGLMLTCGEAALLARAKPILQTMTGKLLDLGADPARAAAFKLFGNLMIVFISSGLGDLFALAQGLNIAPTDARDLFDSFKASNTLDLRGKRMANGDYAATFELAMARKDVRLMLETAAATGAKLEVLPAIASHMDALIAQGLGEQDLGIVAKRR